MNFARKMKRKSLKLSVEQWAALDHLAQLTGSEYRCKPSWRNMLRRLASGECLLLQNINTPKKSGEK